MYSYLQVGKWFKDIIEIEAPYYFLQEYDIQGGKFKQYGRFDRNRLISLVTFKIIYSSGIRLAKIEKGELENQKLYFYSENKSNQEDFEEAMENALRFIQREQRYS